MRVIRLSPIGLIIAAFMGLSVSGQVSLLEGRIGSKPCPAIVVAVALSPDGKLLLTGSESGDVRIAGVGDLGKEILLQGHQAPAVAAVFGPHGQLAATGSLDSSARIWEVETGRQLLQLAGHTAPVVGLAFSPVADLVATASDDGTTRVWRLQRSKGRFSSKEELRFYHQGVLAVGFSSDGRSIFTVSDQAEIRSWSLEKPTVSSLLRGPLEPLTAAAFSLDGQRIVAATDNGALKVWKTDGGEHGVVSLSEDLGGLAVGFSPGGAKVVTASLDGYVHIWDVKGRKRLRLVENAGGKVSAFPLEFAVVTARSQTQPTDVAYTGVTDAQGRVQLSLPIGRYSLTFRAPGFRPVRVEDVELHIAIPTQVNVDLPCGQPDDDNLRIPFSEVQVLLNTINAELSTLVHERQVVELPLNGRNPLQLSGLQAGVATNTRLTEAVINGLRGTFNNIIQDGINIQDPAQREAGFSAVTAPSVENVLEFSIITQNSGPERGFGVAQIGLVTPSGGNRYRGSLFHFHRNTSLNANSFFNNAAGLEREILQRHQFGGRVGGPVVKNRLFFFGYYEGTREAQQSSLLRTVLTETARQGVFAYRGGPDCGLAGAFGDEICSVNLYSFTRLPPDPAVGQILALTPLPNTFSIGDGLNTAGFRFNSSRPRQVDLWGFRLDYGLSTRHSLSAVYSQSGLRLNRGFQNTGSGPDVGEMFPGVPGGGHDSVRRLGTASWRYDPRPRITNELRWGVQRPSFTTFSRPPFPDGFQPDIPNEAPDLLRFVLPLIDNPFQNRLSEQRNTLLHEVTDNLIWNRRRHTFHFGGHARFTRTRLLDENGVLPTLTIGFDPTTNPLSPGEALLPGDASITDRRNAAQLLALLTGTRHFAEQTFNARGREFVEGLGQRRTLRQSLLSFHAGDTFRFRRNLTLSFGLRWEWHGVPTESDGTALLPLGGLQALGDPLAVIDRAGAGTGRSFFNDDYNNFAPSLGVSWDPFSKGRTSVRAGYTVSHVLDNGLTSALAALNGNPGLTVVQPLPNLPGTLAQDGVPTIPSPDFEIPRSLPQQLDLNVLNGLYTIDPDFRTPYVQQWTLSLSHQFLRHTALEVRYVGNRGVKLSRAVDVNQPEFFDNGFLTDFLRARSNLLQSGNPFLGQPLEVFPLLADRGRTLLFNPFVQDLLRDGEIGELLFFMFENRGSVFGGAPDSPCAIPNPSATIPSLLGPDAFFPNCNALFTNFLGNHSFSAYHALQAEVRRRFSQGFSFQANYTFGKVLTDFSGTPENLAPMVDVNRPALERRRANFDLTHSINANLLWELPIGPNRPYFSGPGLAARVLEGWQISSILAWRSGTPVSIISGRGTFSRRANSLSNTAVLGAGLAAADLQDLTGNFQVNGTTSIFDPSLVGPDGTANPNIFSNPEAGEVGSLGLTPVSGPGFFDVDLNVIKKMRLRENLELEFHAEFFNLFNNVNFEVPTNQLGDAVQDVNDPNFGRVFDVFDPRILQFALKVNF